MNINVLGSFLVLKAAKPYLTATSTVVALSSLGSQFAIPNYGFVGSSKAALESMVRQAAYELGPKGIRVNGICAGALDTEALNFFPNGEAVLNASRVHSRTQNFLTVEDVAASCFWLTQPDSQGIQGQTIIVDCGHSLGLSS